MKRELDKTGSEKADLTSKIEELNLHNDSSQRELLRLVNAKQVGAIILQTCHCFYRQKQILRDFSLV